MITKNNSPLTFGEYQTFNSSGLEPGETENQYITTEMITTPGVYTYCGFLANEEDNHTNDSTCKTIYVGKYDWALSDCTVPSVEVEKDVAFPVSYTYENKSQYPLSNLPVRYTVQGISQQDSTLYDLVDSSASNTKSKDFIISKVGVYNVCITLTDSLDQDTTNNTLCKKVTVIDNVGIKDVTLNRMSISPNPVGNLLSVSGVPASENAKFAIISQLGTVVLAGDHTGSGINVNELAAGIYYLRLEGFLPAKFVKE